MSIKGRLERLEHTRSPAKPPYTGAKELLQARFDRADPETQVRLLKAVGEAAERAAKN